MRKSLPLLLSVVLVLVRADPVPKTKVKGVSVVGATGYTCFALDVLAKIAEKANFDYELYLSPDGRYGTMVEGKMNGMIGELENGKADFAIADLTITETRLEHVTFTVPFMENQLAALVRKADVTGLTTLEDLVRRNALAAQADPPGDQISFVVLADGFTAQRLNTTTDEIGAAIRESLASNPNSTVPHGRQGWERVEAEGVAFLIETTQALYTSATNCNLTALSDTRGIFAQKYGFALPKGDPSGRLAAFNAAIEQLKADGTISTLKAKYWPEVCTGRTTCRMDVCSFPHQLATEFKNKNN